MAALPIVACWQVAAGRALRRLRTFQPPVCRSTPAILAAVVTEIVPLLRNIRWLGSSSTLGHVATLKDVAKEAGVSPTTVSYALRGGKYVSHETAERVRAAVEKLGYTANASARNLKYGRSRVIEVGIHEFDAPFFYSKLTEAAVDAIERHGYRALVSRVGLRESEIERAVDAVANPTSDGVLLNAAYLDTTPLGRLSRNRPTVLLDDTRETPTLDTVMTPNERGMKAAVAHLVERGCRSIAVVGLGDYPETELREPRNLQQLRMRAVREAFTEHGVTYRGDWCFPAEWLIEPGREPGRRIAALLRGEGPAADARPDGVLCATDSLALGVIRGLADAGVHVPDDVKVIGFDGLTIDSMVVPSISSVEIDMTDYVGKAVDMLVERIEGRYDGPPRRKESRFRVVPRESTR